MYRDYPAATAGMRSGAWRCAEAGSRGCERVESSTAARGPISRSRWGLVGTIIVRPTGFSNASRRAYGDLSTAYDREYLFLLSDADPIIHQQVAFASSAEIAAGFPSVDMTKRHAVDWFINGGIPPTR